MTSSLLAARRGSQTPRVANYPPYPLSAAPEVIELAEHAGLVLDPWQRYVLTHGLGQRLDESWTAPKVGCWVPRQNGKGAIIEALELAWLFLFDEDEIIHSAHQHRTSAKAYRRLEKLIRQTPDLHALVKQYRHANGEQQIELHAIDCGGGRSCDCPGRLLQYNTRSRTALRGFTSPKLILDEAQELDLDQMAAILPTVSAMKNWQVWFFGTPPDEPAAWVYGLRAEGEAGAPRLGWFDWGAGTYDEKDPACRALVEAPETVYATNPALGIRIELETVDDERRPSGLGVKFPFERLGMWKPRVVKGRAIDPAKWAALADPDSKRAGDVAIGVEISPMRDYAAISVYGLRADGLGHGQVVQYEPGTAWLPAAVQTWRAALDPVAVGMGTATYKALASDLKQLDITVSEQLDEPERGDLVVVGGPDMSAATGDIVADIRDAAFRYVPSRQLDTAAAAVQIRQSGDTVTLSRKDPDADLSPFGSLMVARRAYVMRAHLVTDYDPLANFG